MPVLAATLALAATAASPPACSWDHPGRSPFMGDIPQAVDTYTDIPAPVRNRLKARMRLHEYDDIVLIRRDSIEGSQDYEPGIRSMHFGSGKVCPTVSRDGWAGNHEESGLVYCEDGHCLLVPAVCRNLSRIARRPAEIADQQHVAAAPPSPSPPPPRTDELVFDPPGAGNPGETGPDGTASGGTTPGAAPPDSFAGAGGPPIVTGLPPFTPHRPVPPTSSVPLGWVDRPTDPWPGLPVGGGPLVPVIVPPVPEPQTWAMAFIGLAMLIAAMRRRRRQRHGA